MLSSFPCPLSLPPDMRGEETKARHNERGVEVTGTSPNETEAQNTDASLFSLIVATVDLFVWSVWVCVYSCTQVPNHLDI